MSKDSKKISQARAEDGCLRTQRRKRQKKLITDLLLDYANNSTIHGLHYVAEKGLTIIEKLFWIFFFTGSITLCSVLIRNVYVKWKTSPVIVTVSERFISVGEIPFPSVTICPQIKSKASVYNFSHELIRIANNDETTEQELGQLFDISMFCNFKGQLPESLGQRTYTDESIIDNINYVAPDYIGTFFECSWHGERSACYFDKVLTSEGVCFNMNGLAAQEMFRDTVQSNFNYSERSKLTQGWSVEDGYVGSAKSSFPLRGTEIGATPDLEVILQFESSDIDDLCNVINSGFKIYIQHPTDHPQSSLYHYAALEGQVTSIALSADILSSAPTIEEYDVEIRQCYFQKDRLLRYFKIYTASNCRLECISNYTFKECECVGYYMPHDNSSQICAEGKLTCMKEASRKLAEKELQIRIDQRNEGCRCLPACNSVDYSGEILKTQFNFERYLRNAFESNDLNYDDMFLNTRYSKVELYFKKPQFVSMRRSELFGLTDFLANIGGLLGVFLGFSFLSLIEIVYFITLRLGFTLKRDSKGEEIRPTSFRLSNRNAEPLTK